MDDAESQDFLNGEPQHPASYYTDDGMMLAENYMSSVLDNVEYRVVQKIADKIVAALREPIQDPASPDAERVPELLKHPWVRFAVEVRLMEEAGTTARSVLDRYEEVQPFLASLDLNAKSRRYLSEARRTYLLGLDAACVVFCGAALEQVLKEKVSPVPVRQLSFEDLINQARSNNQLRQHVDAAHMLRKQRNHVLHTGLWEERIEGQVALTAIQNLGKVLAELGAS